MGWLLVLSAECFCSNRSAEERTIGFSPPVLREAVAVLTSALKHGLALGREPGPTPEEKEHRCLLNICFNYLNYPLFLPQTYKVFTALSQLRVTGWNGMSWLRKSASFIPGASCLYFQTVLSQNYKVKPFNVIKAANKAIPILEKKY